MPAAVITAHAHADATSAVARVLASTPAGNVAFGPAAVCAAASAGAPALLELLLDAREPGTVVVDPAALCRAARSLTGCNSTEIQAIVAREFPGVWYPAHCERLEAVIDELRAHCKRLDAVIDKLRTQTSTLAAENALLLEKLNVSKKESEHIQYKENSRATWELCNRDAEIKRLNKIVRDLEGETNYLRESLRNAEAKLVPELDDTTG